MFSLASGAYQAYMAQQQVNVLIVGASSVGKTTFLERLKVTQFTKQSVVVLSEDVESPLLSRQTENDNDEDVFVQEESSSSQTVLSSPPSSLPGRIVSRRRVVDTPTNGGNNCTTTTSSSSTVTRSNQKHKGFWVCPSPPKYQNAMTDSDNDDDDEHVRLSNNDPSRPTSSSSRLETIDLYPPLSPHRNARTAPTTSTTLSPLPTPTPEQYDLKPNSRMLPFVKIRPTIGMNLGQFKNIYGAKCHVWDVGGRLYDLWERYYEDCDAVIFVYKWEDDNDDENDNGRNQTNNNTDDDDDDDRPPPPTRQEQKVLLQTVRQHIPDHIPFLIFLHSWQSPSLHQQSPSRIYHSTEPLLPTLSNHLQGLCVGNAGTGQGVRAAMEWLLPLAKQQQRLRDTLPPSTE